MASVAHGERSPPSLESGLFEGSRGIIQSSISDHYGLMRVLVVAKRSMQSSVTPRTIGIRKSRSTGNASLFLVDRQGRLRRRKITRELRGLQRHLGLDSWRVAPKLHSRRGKFNQSMMVVGDALKHEELG